MRLGANFLSHTFFLILLKHPFQDLNVAFHFVSMLTNALQRFIILLQLQSNFLHHLFVLFGLLFQVFIQYQSMISFFLCFLDAALSNFLFFQCCSLCHVLSLLYAAAASSKVYCFSHIVFLCLYARFEVPDSILSFD